jgi:hypothetical protein
MPGRCRAGAFRLGECLYLGLRPGAATSAAARGCVALGDWRRDSIIYGSGDPCFISSVPDRRNQRWCINERWQVLDGRFVRLQIDGDVDDSRYAVQSPRHMSHAGTGRHSGQDGRLDFWCVAFVLLHIQLTHPVGCITPVLVAIGVARVRDSRHLSGEIPQPPSGVQPASRHRQAES